MKQKRFLALLLILLSSCSGNQITAKWAVVRAEETFTKAYEMRHDRAKRGKRIQLYNESCNQFLSAYQSDPEVFTLIRIENAITACAWAENRQAKETMENFEAKYIQAHPTETEYGDAMPPMSFE